MFGVVVSQFSEGARRSDFPVDVPADFFAPFERIRFGGKLVHSSYLLFSMVLSVTIAKHPYV
jgi:hypothetical protein